MPVSKPSTRLVIGNKVWSSWSLRPWLVMKRFGIPFEEVNVRLRQTDSKAKILAHSPSGKVPLLIDGDLLVWDSLAIIEYLVDRYPDLEIWPADPETRAVARSVSAEMHAGFQALRELCPMDILATRPMPEETEALGHNIRRVIAVWQHCRREYGTGGPFLFGSFSAADAMYAPVASRFKTYVPDLGHYGDDGTAADYIAATFALPEMAEWMAGAAAEAETCGAAS